MKQVRTGRAYLFDQKIEQSELKKKSRIRVLANGVIESIHFDAFMPKQFEAGKPYELKIRHVEITRLSDEALQRLSRGWRPFQSLPLAEMQAARLFSSAGARANGYRIGNHGAHDVERALRA